METSTPLRDDASYLERSLKSVDPPSQPHTSLRDPLYSFARYCTTIDDTDKRILILSTLAYLTMC